MYKEFFIPCAPGYKELNEDPLFFGISIPSTEMENSEEASFKENCVHFVGKRVENSVDDRISEIEISIGESLACV